MIEHMHTETRTHFYEYVYVCVHEYTCVYVCAYPYGHAWI